MTAEIAVYNADAIAVAADSAITVGGKRVWELGNKVFSMGPGHTLGIMYYNNADVAGIPLESIIKVYRKSRKESAFSTTEEFRDDFISYLTHYIQRSIQDPEEAAIILAVSLINEVLVYVTDTESDEEEAKISKSSIENFLEDAPGDISNPDIDDFATSHSEMVHEYIKELLTEQVPLIAVDADADFGFLFRALLKTKIPSELHTGIVFFGFGEEEVFPTVSVAIVDGATTSWLRSWSTVAHAPSHPGDLTSGMLSFAQSDMAELFMSGILPKNIEALQTLSSGYLNDKERDQFLNDFHRLRVEFVSNPILTAIDTLPKEELAIVAESLVDLTSLRRKIDSDVRSVAGPVDVAVVSKGDGFVWIKRKHYFDPQLNNDFIIRKNLG